VASGLLFHRPKSNGRAGAVSGGQVTTAFAIGR
jgi:hypothetical protein